MTRYRANGILLLVTVIWGVAFVAQRYGSAHMSALSFNAVRFILGGFLVFIFAHRRNLGRSKQIGPWLSKDGCILGGVLAAAALLQQHGVPETTTANASFLTIMNVIFVPALARLAGHIPRVLELVGAAMAVIGAYFMSVNGDFSVHRGDWWVLASAFFWALHILFISSVSSRHNPLQLASEQFLVCGFLSAIGAVLFEDLGAQNITAAMPAILFAGGISVAVAYTLQVVAQRYVTPSYAVIILSLEGVCGAISGWIICGESMSERAIMGAGILTLGVICAQLQPDTRAS